MASARIKDLAATVAANEIQAILDSLYLAVDQSAFTNAKKILFKTFLTEAIVADNSINYFAMTPKAFYDSVMTTTRKGIGQLATDGDVTGKTGTGLLNSVHQVLMQAQWKKDWFVKNGEVPGAYYSNTDDLSTAKAISFQFLYNGAVNNGGVIVGPTLPTGVYYNAVNYKFAISSPNGARAGGFNTIYAGAAGSEIQQTMGIGLSMDLYDGGQYLLIFTPGLSGDYYVSMEINATMK